MDNFTSERMMLSVKTKQSFGFYVVLILFLLWTVAQVIVPIKFLPFAIASKLEILKTQIPTFVVIISTIIYSKKLRYHTRYLPFVIFIYILIFTSTLKLAFVNVDISVFGDIVKYFLWVIAMIFVFPNIFDSLSKIKLLLTYSLLLLVMLLTVSLIFLIYVVGTDVVLFVTENRLEFMYGNPLYFGGILYTVVGCSVLLMWLSPTRFERRVLIVLTIGSVFLIYLATARTFLMATAVLMLTYYYLGYRKYRGVFWLGLFSSIIAVGVNWSNINWNQLSSNRLNIWGESIGENLNLRNVLLGNFDVGYAKELTLDSGEVIAVTMQRFAIDNAYLELFVNTGALGLLFFALGLRGILDRNSIHCLHRIGNHKSILDIFYVAYALLVSLLVAAFFYGLYPSFGNTMNSVLFPAVFSIISVVKNYSAEKVILNE